MSINQIQDEIIEEFSCFDDWMDRYSLLIEYGNGLELAKNELNGYHEISIFKNGVTL